MPLVMRIGLAMYRGIESDIVRHPEAVARDGWCHANGSDTLRPKVLVIIILWAHALVLSEAFVDCSTANCCSSVSCRQVEVLGSIIQVTLTYGFIPVDLITVNRAFEYLSFRCRWRYGLDPSPPTRIIPWRKWVERPRLEEIEMRLPTHLESETSLFGLTDLLINQFINAGEWLCKGFHKVLFSELDPSVLDMRESW